MRTLVLKHFLQLNKSFETITLGVLGLSAVLLLILVTSGLSSFPNLSKLAQLERPQAIMTPAPVKVETSPNPILIDFWTHSYFVGVLSKKIDSVKANYIVTLVERYNVSKIEESLIFALMWNESEFISECHSDNLDPITQEILSTDYGLFQLNSRTYKNYTDEQLLDVNTNVRLGVQHLAQNLSDFDGNEKRSVMAYNAGTAKGFAPPDRTSIYADRILNLKVVYDTNLQKYINSQQLVLR